MINHGGLSSHGMTLGLIITFFLFIKLKTNNPLNPPFLRGKPNNPPFDKGGLGGLLDWKQILDILVIPIPLLATFIRIGNFFNSEIVGRTTNLPWAVKFPLYELNPLLRHPTQLYEAIFTLALFFILYSLFKKNSQKLPQLFIFHLFLLTYFGGRFLLEFTKEYQTSWEGILTAGQWLSIPFIIWGIAYLINNKKTPPK